MYYLFLKDDKLEQYKKDFEQVKQSIEKGSTPVFNEMSCAKTTLIESVPYNVTLGMFVVVAALVMDNLKISELIKIGLVLVVNNSMSSLANFVFVNLKHRLRIKLCKRMGIEPSNKNIAVMESLEYQTV